MSKLRKAAFNEKEKLNIATNLKYLLAKIRYNGRQLARELGLHPGRIETLMNRGSVSEEIVRQVASRFGLSLYQIKSDFMALEELDKKKEQPFNIVTYNKLLSIVEQVIDTHNFVLTKEALDIVVETAMANEHIILNMQESLLGMILILIKEGMIKKK